MKFADSEQRIDSGHSKFPVAAGILLGIGLGGFFDGIVLHQLLQWHHMFTSAGLPADTLANLRLNTFFDGVFHAVTWVFTVAGLALLWRHAARTHLWWSGKLLAGSLLVGFGLFNVVEGLIDHQLLELHHVNETVPLDQRLWWDLGFLGWGAAMIAGGALLLRRGESQSRNELRRAARPQSKCGTDDISGSTTRVAPATSA